MNLQLFSRWADVARQHSGSSLIGQLLNDQNILDLDYESIIYVRDLDGSIYFVDQFSICLDWRKFHRSRVSLSCN